MTMSKEYKSCIGMVSSSSSSLNAVQYFLRDNNKRYANRERVKERRIAVKIKEILFGYIKWINTKKNIDWTNITTKRTAKIPYENKANKNQNGLSCNNNEY